MAHAALLSPEGNITSGPLATVFLCIIQHGAKALPFQEAALDITVEVQHETKAADVVIQIVLRLGHNATL